VLAENRHDGPAVQPTGLGTLLFADDGLDPYLEDPATLWLLHWQIASNRARATTWFWTFSHFHEPEFTREALTSALWQEFAPAAETLALADLARKPGSPGRLFKIDESSLAERLEGIEGRTNGALAYGENVKM
jgi:hypothetical protein